MDWIQELMFALALWQQVKTLKDQGASGEVDLTVSATIKATSQTVQLPGTLKVTL